MASSRLCVAVAGVLLGTLACSPAPERGRTSLSPRPTEAPQPSPTAPTAPADRPDDHDHDHDHNQATVPEVRTPEPRRSFVTIPALGLRGFPVVRYRGAPDDAPGTRIQDAGDMASPRGPRGGVGPGEVGNFIVTGHRLTGTAPLRDSPSLRPGARIRVRTGDVVRVYEVRRTRWTSFRSERSLAGQRAPVPGRPGRRATRPMLTLSTCATPEDHARGNYWSDEFGNPEHRIDKIAVLVRSRPA